MLERGCLLVYFAYPFFYLPFVPLCNGMQELTFMLCLGTLVGTYATSNGGSGTTEAYVSRWRYRGEGQKISEGEFVFPSA